MRRLLTGLAVALIAFVMAMLALQYVVQRPAPAAFAVVIASGIGLEPEGRFGVTGRAFRAHGRASDDFGPAGAQVARSRFALCRDVAGHFVPNEEDAGTMCLRPAATRFVGDAPALMQAIASAKPGDVIEILPGTYRITGRSLSVATGGRADAPIVVRAARLGDATLKFDMAEGFGVSAPFWAFENLVIEGVCAKEFNCQHAFHITRQGHDTVLRNNRISDFDAQIKINAGRGDTGVPDHVLIDHNSLIDSHVRDSGYPVTKIDSVRASDTIITGNVIADFAKGRGDHRSYGAFTKGGGAGNRMERNLVICEWMHRGGDRVGLSFGGGGTGDQFCVGGSCKIEDRDGLMRSNVVIGCGDVGLYLRRAAGARIERNLVAATRGIDGRFDTTDATLSGNIVDGRIMAWKGAKLNSADNIVAGWRALFMKRVSATLFANPQRGDFRAFGARPAAPVTPGARDFCGNLYGPTAPAGPFGAACAPDIPALR